MSRVALQRRDMQQPCAFDGNSTCTLIFDNGHEIRYSDSWVQYTGVHTPDSETSHSTGQPGANMFISFHGTRIAATGTIPAGEAPLSANYIIDNGQVITQSVSGVPQDAFHQTLFTSPVLGNGPHNLTVQVIETGSGRNYTFQNFQVATSEGNNATDSSENGTNSGFRGKSLAIIGGILGAVVFLLLIIVCVFWFWRKKRRALMSGTGERQLHPTMFYAYSPSDTYYNEGEKYTGRLASIIDTDSKFTFTIPRDIARQSGRSWVPVSLPPTVPQSALFSDHDISDCSTYKGSSVIIPQRQMERSRFSPYTSMAFSSREPREPMSQLPPGGASESGPRSPSSLTPSSVTHERRMI